MSEASFPSTPMARWNRARGVWETAQSNVCGHWEPYSQTWPTSGMTRHGVAYVLPTWEPRIPDSGSSSLLPTPVAADGERRSMTYSQGSPTLAGALLPTPTARDHKGANQRADQTCLHGALLPTPTTSDRFGPGRHGDGGPDLRTAVQTFLPTPTARLGDSRGTSTPERRRDLNPKRSGELDEVATHLLPPNGATTSRRSAGGNPCCNDRPQLLLWPDNAAADNSTPDSSNG
jgi:hypothetical protein